MISIRNFFTNRTVLTLAGVLAAVGLAAGSASASGRLGGWGGHMAHHGSVEQQAKHDGVVAAIKAGDYAKFKSLVGDQGPFSSVTEAQFPKLKEMINHLEAARAIGDELGLKGPMGR